MDGVYRFVVDVYDHKHDNKRVVHEGQEVSVRFMEAYIDKLAEMYKDDHSLCLSREMPHPITGKPSYPVIGWWTIKNSKLIPGEL